MRHDMSRLFNLARAWKLVSPDFVNPARAAPRGTVDGVVRNEEHPRERYPSAEEMAAIRIALDRHPNQRRADIIRLLIFTGCRRNEALTATWSDIDFGKSMWNRPAIRQKGKKSQRAVGTASRRVVARHSQPASRRWHLQA
jgi:integrase